MVRNRVVALIACLSIAVGCVPGRVFADPAVAAPRAATQTAGTAVLKGFIADQVTGLPIADADVTLYHGTAKIAKTTSDAQGRFAFAHLAPEVYNAIADARGYADGRTGDIAVLAGQDTEISLVLTKSSGSSSIKTIAVVSSQGGGGGALASTTTITRTIDPTLLADEGYNRFNEAIGQLPGVNMLGGTTAAVGDDASIDIRGLGPSETQTLLDGHPVGPMGVYGINGGGGAFPSSGFNFSDSPFFALSKVQVTFGSGASGLYGTDATGGTIDMVTISPTKAREIGLLQGEGNQGQQETAIKFTGTDGRLGYALVGSVQGTYGLFAPQQIAQTARPNNNGNLNNGGACTASNDLTSCNLALNTYEVDADTSLRSALAKLQYSISQNTLFSSTFYGAWQYADSTGNGDADDIPYNTRLAEIQTNPGNCVLAGGPAGNTNGYAVITNGNPNACYSVQQFAANSYGPYGGGEGRDRGTGFFDYHDRLQSVSGHSTYAADYYFDHYEFWKSSETAAGLDPTGTFYVGDGYTQFLNTQGLMLSDDISYDNHDIGFGYFVNHQEQSRLEYQFNGPQLYDYVPSQTAGMGSAFARGEFTVDPKFSIFANAWLKKSTVTQQTNFDPRLSLVFRPDLHDVVRLTFGHTTGDPAPELKYGAATITSSPQSLNPICLPNANSVGSDINPNIEAEGANDYELGVAHSFHDDSSVQLNLYTTSVVNQLFAANAPLSGYPSGTVPYALLQQYAARIASACPGLGITPNNVIGYLGVAATYNAASAQYRGIELTGRARLTKHLYAEYGYDVQSAVQNGIPASILLNNPFTINGAQIVGIPVHKASLGLDYSIDGWDSRLDGYYVGTNNNKNSPAYTFFNGTLSKKLGHGLSAHLGVQNVFNQDDADYGYFGHQLFVPENQYFHDTTSIEEAVNQGNQTQLELFGLASRSFIFTLQKQL